MLLPREEARRVIKEKLPEKITMRMLVDHGIGTPQMWHRHRKLGRIKIRYTDGKPMYHTKNDVLAWVDTQYPTKEYAKRIRKHQEVIDDSLWLSVKKRLTMIFS